jgi:hypothetical protein
MKGGICKARMGDAMEIGSKPIVESMIDPRLATDGSVVEYKDMVVGFSQGEGVDLDVTLASRFSQKEGGDLVEVDALVAGGFEVHGRDTHDSCC